jgi:4,5-DOPA dioxygenase extradiol
MYSRNDLLILFIGDGAPMNAVRDSAFTRAPRHMGKTLARPAAVLSISAHWETDGTRILGHATPPKLNDFFGKHPDLEALAYAAPGAPALAEEIRRLIPGATVIEDRGIDHGTWSVAIHLFPNADVPIYQLSIDKDLSAQAHFELGRRLQPLRTKGVLILATGTICHNLRQLDYDQLAPPLAWNTAFDAQIAAALSAKDHARIVEHQTRFAEHAALAVPTPEQFTPLLYAVGATRHEDELTLVHEGFAHAAITLRSVMWR